MEQTVTSNSGNIDEEVLHSQLIQAVRKGDDCRLRTIIEPLQNTQKLYEVLSKPSRSGQLPLHYPLDYPSKSENRLGVVQVILDSILASEKVKYLLLGDANGRTALHTAAAAGEIDVINAILQPFSHCERFKLICVADRWGKKALQQSLTDESRRLIESFVIDFSDANEHDMLLRSTGTQRNEQHNGDPDPNSIFSISEHQQHDDNGRANVDHLTAENSFSNIETLLEMVIELNSYNAVISLKNEQGETILHKAANQKRVDIVRKILTALPKTSDQHWKLISQKCSHDKTALHCASMAGCLEIVKLLLDYAGKQDSDLVKMKDLFNCEAIRYAATSELRILLPMVETHYWKRLFKDPTVIIFYNTFERFNDRWKRIGAEAEKDDMVAFFQAFGIKPKVHVNFSKQTLIEKITNAVKEDHADISACIVVVMSHGEAGIIYDCNIEKMEIQRILDCLGKNQMLELTPKVLMLQCCQDVAAGVNRNGSSRCHHAGRDADPTAPLLGRRAVEPAPTYSIGTRDTCIITSTLREKSSHRGAFARALSIISRNRSGPTNLTEIFPALSREMGRHMEESDLQQIPELNSTLRKELPFKNPLKHTPTMMEKLRARVSAHVS